MTSTPRRLGRPTSERGGAVARRAGAGHEDRHRGAEAVLDLQRTAGNRVTRRLLSGRGPTVTAPPVVQRAPYGLDAPKIRGTYVDLAVKLWKTQPTMDLKDFVNAAMQPIAAELKAGGVPLFSWTFVSGKGASGVFDSTIWKVKVNVSKFSTQGTPRVLQDLSEDEVTEVVGTLYHESRHADQDVVVLRSLLDQKKTPAQIHAATKIRKDVIAAVKATTYATPLDPDQVAHAGRMFDVMYGAHKELLAFLMAHSDAFDALDTLSKPASTPSAAAPSVKVLTTWRTSVLQPKVTRMAAAKNLTQVETALLGRLRAVDGALTALSAGWTKVVGAKKPAPADVAAVRTLAGAARDAIADAYVNLEGEADAFRVEGQVKADFAAKIGTP